MDRIYEDILSNSTILLAEDEDTLRDSFKKVLELYVKEVFIAKDGQEAYDLYLKSNPTILITDVKMPKLNGIELIKKIRANNSSIPIVITSAYTDQEYLLESIKLSLVEYLVKPLKESDLDRVLSECAKVIQKDIKYKEKLEDNLFYDYVNKVITHNNQTIKLTQKEVELIELLLKNRGNLVTKSKIEHTLYIYDDAPPSALKNLIFKLRRKLPINVIKTQGKLGYLIQ